MGVEAFGGYLRVPRINPYLPARVEYLGNNTKQFSSKDIGKPVKLAGETTGLCAFGDEIYGFVESVEVGSDQGYSYGAVLCDPGHEVIAKDEANDLAVGDLVVAGTPTALGTVTPNGGINVVRIQASSNDQLLNAGGLAIKAGGSAVVKTANITRALIGGQLVTKAAGDMPALVGTITAAKYNVFAFFMDAAGTLTTKMGVEGATAVAVEFPAAPVGTIMLGFVLLTHTSDFVGGTTALDVSGGTPVYVDTNTPLGGSGVKHRWQVLAKYVAGSMTGSVMLRKI